MTAAIRTDAIGLTTLTLLGASWLLFATIFVAMFATRRRPARSEVAKRAPVALAGIVLQGVASTLVWGVHRPLWWPFSPSAAGEAALSVVALALAWGGSVLCLWSVQILGKQWTLQARVLKEHELITQGPYSVVRNPIYLGLFALIVSTGLVLSTWWALLGAVVIYLAGTMVRIRAEERLLREKFGRQFDDYAAHVPALVPLGIGRHVRS